MSTNKNREDVLTSIYVGEHTNNNNPIISQNVKKKIAENRNPQSRNVYLFRENCAGFKAKGTPQNYTDLRNDHIKNNKVFCDDTFAPEIALGKSAENIVWKRPSEIVKFPQFFVNGATRFDVNQGELGDCWFLAAVANITENQKLFEIVVPPDQTFDEPNYVGIFHFRFWQYGRWVDIVIDDRLPTKENGELIYLKSTDQNEFWTPLLEKAYAKLYGSYENISGGQIVEALEDMSGGISEFYRANEPFIYDILTSSYERSSFMGCSIASNVMEGECADGLITSHAYSITKVETLTSDLSDSHSEWKLIRIRNPWGKIEWNGAWSDGSELWKQVSEEVKNNLLRPKEDGEFWMDLQDFQNRFSFLDICHLSPDAYLMEQDQKQWHVSTFEGSWIPGVTAGGSVQNTDTFAFNPQYFISIEGNEENKKYAVVLSLTQMHKRVQNAQNLPLEIAIYSANQVDAPEVKVLDKNFLASNQPLKVFKKPGVRQLSARLFLAPGNYCIIPCITHSNVQGNYFLRIFAEVDSDVTSSDSDIGYSTFQDTTIKEVAVQHVNATFPQVFKKIAGNESEVGWKPVRKILNRIYNKQPLFACLTRPKKVFSPEICRNIVALSDKNYSGKLDYQEFWDLVTDITTLDIIFRKFDKDRSGKLDGFELKDLLFQCGYKVNKHLLGIVMVRYGERGSMSFQNFVVCVLKLREMIGEYDGRKANDNPAITFNKEEFLLTTMYK